MASRLDALRAVSSKLPQLDPQAVQRSQLTQQALLGAARMGQQASARNVGQTLGTAAEQQQQQLNVQQAQAGEQLATQVQGAELQQQTAQRQQALGQQEIAQKQELQQKQIESGRRLQEQGQILDTELTEQSRSIDSWLANKSEAMQDLVRNRQNSLKLEGGQYKLQSAEQFVEFALTNAKSEEELAEYKQSMDQALEETINTIQWAFDRSIQKMEHEAELLRGQEKNDALLRIQERKKEMARALRIKKGQVANISALAGAATDAGLAGYKYSQAGSAGTLNPNIQEVVS